MGACRIVNAGLESAVSSINELQQKYLDAGEQLIQELNDAIAEMEGDAKDEFKAFIDGDVKTFLAQDLPAAIKGMADLLEANRSNFEEIDRQIANSIRGE